MGFLSNREKSVTVEQVGSGWLLTWNAPRDDDDQYSSMAVYPKRRELPTSGREIYTDKKKLHKRLQEFL